MYRRLALSHSQKVALLIAFENPQGEYTYRVMRRLFGYSKSSVSRSARRLERAGLVARDTHHAHITARARHLVGAAMLKPSTEWFSATLAALSYIEFAQRIESNCKAHVVRAVASQYRNTTT